MSNPKFKQIWVLKEWSTSDKAKRLGGLLAHELRMHKVPLYKAIDVAVEEAIAKREKGAP